jgi:hypothetical protein
MYHQRVVQLMLSYLNGALLSALLLVLLLV